jgi:hypothetical protein
MSPGRNDCSTRPLVASSDADQRNAEIGPLLAAQMCHGFPDCYLEGRLHHTGQKMASAHGAVPEPKYRVKVEACLAVVAFRDVPEQAENFALLADDDRPVGFGGEVEPADPGFGKGADRRHRGATDALLVSEVGDP